MPRSPERDSARTPKWLQSRPRPAAGRKVAGHGARSNAAVELHFDRRTPKPGARGPRMLFGACSESGGLEGRRGHGQGFARGLLHVSQTWMAIPVESATGSPDTGTGESGSPDRGCRFPRDPPRSHTHGFVTADEGPDTCGPTEREERAAGGLVFSPAVAEFSAPALSIISDDYTDWRLLTPLALRPRGVMQPPQARAASRDSLRGRRPRRHGHSPPGGDLGAAPARSTKGWKLASSRPSAQRHGRARRSPPSRWLQHRSPRPGRLVRGSAAASHTPTARTCASACLRPRSGESPPARGPGPARRPFPPPSQPESPTKAGACDARRPAGGRHHQASAEAPVTSCGRASPAPASAEPQQRPPLAAASDGRSAAPGPPRVAQVQPATAHQAAARTPADVWDTAGGVWVSSVVVGLCSRGGKGCVKRERKTERQKPGNMCYQRTASETPPHTRRSR